jgi:hypothetical protein
MGGMARGRSFWPAATWPICARVQRYVATSVVDNAKVRSKGNRGEAARYMDGLYPRGLFN